MNEYSFDLHLIAPSGSEYSGKTSDLLGVEGVSRFGAFDLRVIVPFRSVEKRLTVE